MDKIRDTKILDAVASAIQYEKDCFEFYLKNYEESKEGTSVKEFFKQLAEDAEEHIQLIQNIYNELKGGTSFPNLKELAPIHKFHSTAIFKVMKKIERNVKEKTKDSMDNIHKAIRAIEDARDFYTKVKEKFSDPSVKILFKRLADYNEDNRLVVESQYQFLSQTDKTNYYWEDEELLNSRPA